MYFTVVVRELVTTIALARPPRAGADMALEMFDDHLDLLGDVSRCSTRNLKAPAPPSSWADRDRPPPP